MNVPAARSRANDISRLLNAQGFGAHLPVPPTAQGAAIIVVIPGGYAHAAATMLSRTGYSVREHGNDPAHPGCVRLAVSTVRRQVHASRAPSRPTSARRASIAASGYLPKPVTEQPGSWVEVTRDDVKAVNMFTWQKCRFQVSTGIDPETGKVATSFPTGYRQGIEHFMKMHGYEGEIVAGHRPGVLRALWSRRYVPEEK